MIMLGAIYYNFVMIFLNNRIQCESIHKTLNYITTHFDKFEHIYGKSEIYFISLCWYIRFHRKHQQKCIYI